MQFNERGMIQNLKYPVSLTDMALSGDKRYLLSIGMYKPSIRIYDLDNLAMKVERHLESEPLKILSLVDDSSKLCVLRNDRVIEFHARYGHHENVKVPSFCFDMCFNKFKAELVSGGRGASVYRFNLDQGRFLSSYSTTIEEILSIEMNEANGLIAIGGDNKIQFIDQRSRSVVKTVEYDESPCTLSFCSSGIDFGVGTSEGVVYYHDLRTRNELFKNTHDTSIKKVAFNDKVLMSMDKNMLRCCDRSGVVGEYVSETEMNSFECDGGAVIIGYDNGEVKDIVSEGLGETPSWCRIIEE